MREHKGSWLDDPEWEALQKRLYERLTPKFKRPADGTHADLSGSDTPKPAQPKKLELSLKLILPKLPKVQLPKLKKARIVAATGAVCLVVVGAVTAALISVNKDKQQGTDEARGVLSEAVLEPEYDPVLPNGNREETTSKKIAYDPSRKVTSFTDEIGGHRITVSQQPLPDNFKSNPDEEVRKLAESFSAKEVISSSTPMAYLGTSAKGPQTVIFHKKDLLVFLFSNNTIDKHDWAEYITRLR